MAAYGIWLKGMNPTPKEAPRVYERVEALAVVTAGADPQLSALVAAWDGRPEEFSQALSLAEKVR